MIRCRQPSRERKLTGKPNSVVVGPLPFAGSQPNITENTIISINPTQNVGSENPRIDPAMMERPAMEFGLSPAQRPSGMPRMIAISIAAIASSIVAGMRSRIRPSAGVLCTNDRPRSPCTAPFRNVRYCAHSGLLRPSAAIARSRSAWSAWGLIKISIGLPIA